MNVSTTCHAPRPRRRSLLAGAAALGLVLAIGMPAALDGPGAHIKAAWAGKGNGKDSGGGKGRGKDHDGGNAYGHSRAASGRGSTFDGGHGARVKLPGSLNAAHASPRALERANRNSRVGALGAYMDAMNDYVDAVANGSEAERQAALDAAAAALADASNKDSQIDPGVVDAVNTTLDGKKPGFSHAAVAGDPVHDAEPAIAARIDPSMAP